jgi:hypothetical protein
VGVVLVRRRCRRHRKRWLINQTHPERESQESKNDISIYLYKKEKEGILDALFHLYEMSRTILIRIQNLGSNFGLRCFLNTMCF